MAHLRCDFRSEVLDMNSSMVVVLPEGPRMDEVRVVTLLHGLADNCSGWSRYTSVERYARQYHVALVIPEVQRSFYADMTFGLPYFRFIHDELPEICRRFFSFSDRREHHYLMGLSMGGYAAWKCALLTPERYGGCASFSAVTRLPERAASAPAAEKGEWIARFGDPMVIADQNDLFSQADHTRLPEDFQSYIACGQQDPLLQENKAFAQKLLHQGAQVRFETWEGGHDWDFWDEAVKRAMIRFFDPAKGGGT